MINAGNIVNKTKFHVSLRYKEITTFDLRQKQYDDMLKYYLMAIEKGNVLAVDFIHDFLNNEHKTHIMFIIKNRKTMHNKILKKVNTILVEYENYDSELKKDDCCVCFGENTYMALMNCDHPVCFDCVKKLDKCPICRNEI